MQWHPVLPIICSVSNGVVNIWAQMQTVCMYVCMYVCTYVHMYVMFYCVNIKKISIYNMLFVRTYTLCSCGHVTYARTYVHISLMRARLIFLSFRKNESGSSDYVHA